MSFICRYTETPEEKKEEEDFFVVASACTLHTISEWILFLIIRFSGLEYEELLSVGDYHWISLRVLYVVVHGGNKKSD